MTTKQTGGKRATPATPKKDRKVPIIGIVFAVVAITLIAAITLSSDQAIGSEFGDVTVSGESLPFYSQNQPDDAIGMAAPAVTGVDFDGNEVSLTPGDGTAKAVLFLAHWCPHCQAEVPRVQAWLDGGGSVPGIEIVTVATSMNSAQPNYPPSEWLEREGWTPPVIRDDSDFSALQAYGAGGFPYWVFVDAEGNVVRRSSGELDLPTLQAYLEEAAPAAG